MSGEKEVVQSRKKKEHTIYWCKRLSKEPQEAAEYGLHPGAYACMINPDNHKRQRGRKCEQKPPNRNRDTQANPLTGSVNVARQAGPIEGGIYPILCGHCHGFLALQLPGPLSPGGR